MERTEDKAYKIREELEKGIIEARRDYDKAHPQDTMAVYYSGKRLISLWTSYALPISEISTEKTELKKAVGNLQEIIDKVHYIKTMLGFKD